MLRIRTLKLQNESFRNQWFEEALDHWEYDEFKRRERWRKGWISFDCAVYNAAEERIYLGITSFDADIFKAYDRRSGQFVDLGYGQIADPFDAKFHRSLLMASDGCVYGAIALLHDVDKYFDAPGGAIVRYDPQTETLTKIGIVLPHVYIQSIAMDDERGVVYCLCFAPEKLASFSLKTGESRDLGLIGTGIGGMAVSENLVLDDDGCVWSNWSLTRAWQDAPGPDAIRLCKFDPRLGRIIFFQKGLPYPDGRPGFAKTEGFFNFNDGFIYASGFNGSFYRIDPQSGEATFLFTPTPDRPSRLTSLVKTGDSIAYGVTGKKGHCEFMRIDYRRGTFEKLGVIKDDDGTALWQCHYIIAANDGVFYLCENDNPYRSSYLWEITL